MSRINDSGRPIKEFIFRVFLWLFIIAGISGVAVVVIAWINGESVPQYFIDIGPLLLVLVTLIYIGFAGLAYVEGKKERELTRQSLEFSEEDLRLKQKSSIIDVIALSIKPTLSSFKRDRGLLNKTIHTSQAYPALPDMDVAEKPLLRDLNRHYPESIYDIPAYLAVRTVYEHEREVLRQKLQEKIPHSMPELPLNSILEAAGSSLEEISSPEDAFMEKVEQQNEILADIALSGEPSGSSKAWIDNNIQSISRELVDFRESEELTEYVDRLENSRLDLDEENGDIIAGLEEAKEAMMQEYDIKNSEIKKRNREGAN